MPEARPDMAWTCREDDIVREMYADHTLEDIAARIGHRSPNSIRKRAGALGLRRSIEYTTNLRRRARAERLEVCQPGWLLPNAEPIACCEGDQPWYRLARENNQRFLELLQDEFLTSGRSG